MKAEEIIKMFNAAGEVAGWKPGAGNPLVINYLTHFAKLVADKERDECAKVCDEMRSLYRHQASGCNEGIYDFKQIAAEEIIDEIRARGEK